MGFEGKYNISESLILRGGTVVQANGTQRADVLIAEGHIAAVGPDLEAPPGVESVDVGGLHILPGLIDLHVHLREPGGEHKENFETGTRAAIAGGITTVLAMPNTQPPITDQHTLDDVKKRAEGRIFCDVGFFLGATPDNAESAASVRGAAGLKVYMGSSTGSLLVDDVCDQLAHFQNWPADKLLAVHAEDEALVRRYMAEEGLRRPAACAIAATRQALALAAITGRRLHICHVSTPEEMWMIEDARRRGVRVTCEATIHHLYFGVVDEHADDPRVRVNPPLRTTEAVNALWKCFDSLDAIASDHAPHTIAEKTGPNPPAGLPGLETMLPVLLNAAHGDDLDLPEVVKRMATRPAEIAGLHDRGAVEAGKLAHLTLIDMAGTTEIWNDKLFTRCGWSPWNEQTLEGQIVSVYLRGREVFRRGRFRVRRGKGEVLDFDS